MCCVRVIALPCPAGGPPWRCRSGAHQTHCCLQARVDTVTRQQHWCKLRPQQPLAVRLRATHSWQPSLPCSPLPRTPPATLTSIHVAVRPPKARLVNGHHLQVLAKTCRDALHPGAQVNLHPAEPAAERDIRVNLLQEGREVDIHISGDTRQVLEPQDCLRQSTPAGLAHSMRMHIAIPPSPHAPLPSPLPTCCSANASRPTAGSES